MPIRNYGTDSAMTLLELNEIIEQLVVIPQTKGIWVTAETADLSRKRHCYMELIQKDDAGNTVARSRAAIWASSLYYIDEKFTSATGQRLATGMKVMVRVNVTFHPVYGLLLVIDDINAEFTLGDVLRRRREIIKRLTDEGLIDLNKSLEWHEPLQRIAIISAETAAGYGDFMNQLENNGYGLKFFTRLFPATVQGPTAPGSIIDALVQISEYENFFDAVVIIRGGGSSDDLSCFEDYDLAASIAQFPLPVIIGIGHERDVTLLDYVAAMRVKTPTAAAEWLISRGAESLERLKMIGNEIYATVIAMISESGNKLAAAHAQLPALAQTAVERSAARLNAAGLSLSAVFANIIAPQSALLDSKAADMRKYAADAVSFAAHRLEAAEQLVAALSPQAVLKRGYTITSIGSKIIRTAADVKAGDVITTRFADGEVISEAIESNSKAK